MRRIAICFLTVLIFLVIAFGVFRRWAITHLSFSGVGSAHAIEASGVARTIDTLSQSIKEGKLPSMKEDFTSVGSPREEAKLIELRRFLQVFEAGFGRPPQNASELSSLATRSALSPEQRILAKRYASDCEIFTFPEHSYLLNCDNWQPTDIKDLQALVERFDTTTEKFYAVQKHIFLYSPPYANRQGRPDKR